MSELRLSRQTGTIKERLEHARQLDYISIEQAALLVGCSVKTIRRRLPALDRTIRDGRLVRLHRVTVMRYFLKWPSLPPQSMHP